MFIAPIVALTPTVLLIANSYTYVLRLLLVTLALIANDMCIKQCAGGNFDLEGAGFINLSFFIGASLSLLRVIVSVELLQRERVLQKVAMTIAMFVALYACLSYFDFYRMGCNLSAWKTHQVLIKRGGLISVAGFSSIT